MTGEGTTPWQETREPLEVEIATKEDCDAMLALQQAQAVWIRHAMRRIFRLELATLVLVLANLGILGLVFR